jgi:sugar lactone lactonase YvrE
MSQINQFNQPLVKLGQQLTRPECVLTNAIGDVFVSDFRGGVSRIAANGEQSYWGGEHPEFGPLQTNGFAMLADGSFLIAHLGAEQGGVFRLTRDNAIYDWLLEVDGVALPPTNFVYLDHQGRIWITVSTRTQPRADAYRKSCDDGFIVLVDEQGARIVADGLGYTNELWVNPEGTELYVNATFSRELIKYQIIDNQLRHAQVITQFSAATFPDGLTMDTSGNLWVTSIVSNRVIRVSPSGEQQIWLEDSDDEHLQWVEQAFQDDVMGRPHLDGNPAKQLHNISSLAFATDGILLGCLLGESITKIKTTISGIKPAHWLFK